MLLFHATAEKRKLPVGKRKERANNRGKPLNSTCIRWYVLYCVVEYIPVAVELRRKYFV
jgi:hypothetical protein